MEQAVAATGLELNRAHVKAAGAGQFISFGFFLGQTRLLNIVSLGQNRVKLIKFIPKFILLFSPKNHIKYALFSYKIYFKYLKVGKMESKFIYKIRVINYPPFYNERRSHFLSQVSPRPSSLKLTRAAGVIISPCPTMVGSRLLVDLTKPSHTKCHQAP